MVNVPMPPALSAWLPSSIFMAVIFLHHTSSQVSITSYMMHSSEHFEGIILQPMEVLLLVLFYR